MMRSLFAGVTGLRSHQTKMDVIGNNIANVNTLGFKKSAANFADLYSETTSAASAPTGNKGGTNSNQIGLGVACNAIVVKHTPGAPSYTGNTLDLAISGDGYFTVRTGANGEVAYTRAGNLSVSSNGSLVTAAGYFVQTFNSVYQQGSNGQIASTAGLSNAEATGFQKFTFDEREVDVNRAPSGTYTVALNEKNMVNLYKNGVLIESDIPVQIMSGPDSTPNPKNLNEVGRFDPNTKYEINLKGLGTVSFESDGNLYSTTGLKNNTRYGDGAVTVSSLNSTLAQNSTTKYLPTGTYKIAMGKNGPEIQASFSDDQLKDMGLIDADGNVNADGQAYYITKDGTTYDPQPAQPGSFLDDENVVARIVNTGDADKPVWTLETKAPADNPTDNDPKFKWDTNMSLTSGGEDVGSDVDKLKKGTTYTMHTPMGDITFTAGATMEVANPFSLDGTVTGDSKLMAGFNDMFKDVSFAVSSQVTQGPGTTAFNTGLSYLSSMLQNATISVTNNDGFLSGPNRGDMVINKDMYQNVMVNENGAVMAQLKVDAVYDPLTGEIRPMTENDIGNDALTKMGAGDSVVLGYLAMANFSNPEGLDKIGTNLYQTTANSGLPMFGLAGEEDFGAIVGSSLEMSNVDLAEEMVNMITTQRGMQANSRIITVTDTLLEELINLKR